VQKKAGRSREFGGVQSWVFWISGDGDGPLAVKILMPGILWGWFLGAGENANAEIIVGIMRHSNIERMRTDS
jgi:hypothetical protein